MRHAKAVLVAAACLVVALLSVFGAGLANSQANDRATIENGVHQRAVLAAALLDGVFQTVASEASQASQLYGTATVSTEALDAHLGNSRYLVVTDASGQVLASSSRGFTDQARRELANSAVFSFLRQGRPWAVGDVQPYGSATVIDIAVPFSTPYGPRVLIAGANPAAIGQFAMPELRSIPGVQGAHSTLLDGNDVVVATTNPATHPGARATQAGQQALTQAGGSLQGRYFQQAALANTTLRVVLSAPTSALFASVSGIHRLLPWLLLMAFALVAAVALVLGGRAVRTSSRLRHLNDRLAEVNGELAGANVTLEQRAAELARSNEELDHFASIASHDLQEPLRKVRTYTQRLAVIEADNLSEKGHEYLWRANAAGARMQDLIEDLLRYARLGTQVRGFAATDLNKIAAEVVEDLADQIEEAGAVVTIGDLPYVHGDPAQLRQLLQNLLSNGLKFRRDGVTPKVSIDATIDGPHAEITVRDNGIGFDMRYSERIFRVFERLHGRSEYPGTGIGLAVCRKIVERHGGIIRATGDVGLGATFTVVLPTGRRTEIIDLRDPAVPDRSEGEGKHPAHV